MHRFRYVILGVGLLALAYAGWWVFGRSLDQEVLAAQHKFLAAVEDRDWDEIQGMLTMDYMDEAGHDRDTVMVDARKVFGSFIFLSFQTELVQLLAAQKQATLKMKITVEGQGLGISPMVISQANSLKGPWLFHWQKKGRWPWDWKIIQIHHKALYGEDG